MNCETADPLRHLATEAVRRLRAGGHVAYWAGGCVRDILLGRTPKDYDIATEATPDMVLALFPGAVAVGKSFGVVRAPVGGTYFEVATFRKDHAYLDGRRPQSVSFTDAASDARRRDFTINALFLDPLTGAVLDYVNGRSDLAARLIRCVDQPLERFAEDYLRMLRAVRFAGTLQFSIEPATAAAIRALASRVAGISPERVRDELARTLVESKKPGDTLRLMDDLGILTVLLPEISLLKQQPQPPEFHPEGDVFTHTVIMLNAMKDPSVPLAFSVLLHDVGKPATARHDGLRLRFDGHNTGGAVQAVEIMTRLRFPNDDIEVVAHCVRDHMRFLDVQRMKRSTLRRLVGQPTFPLELELHRLDCLASHGNLENYEFLREFCRQLAEEPALPPSWITGHDIMGLGVPEGPDVGRWLRKAYDAQIENRSAGRDELMEWLREELSRNRP